MYVSHINKPPNLLLPLKKIATNYDYLNPV